MDEVAIMQAFGVKQGPDCLREVIPNSYGTRLKVYSEIKALLNRSLVNQVCNKVGCCYLLVRLNVKYLYDFILDN